MSDEPFTVKVKLIQKPQEITDDEGPDQVVVTSQVATEEGSKIVPYWVPQR